MTQLATTTDLGGRLEQVIINGNLSVLQPEERVRYYNAVCESVGLNPLTQPLAYLTLNGKLVLYATKGATDQLRQVHGISIEITDRTMMAEAGLYVVTARATDRSGRSDESTGAVSVGKLVGENLANALMKAETKAKRRATLSLTGLGILDETEVDSIPDSAKREPVRVPVARSAAIPSRVAQDVERAAFEAYQTERGEPAPVDTDTGEIVETNGPEVRQLDLTDKHALMWEAFWAKTEALGFTPQSVREFVGVDAETFDAMTRDDLQRVLNDLKAVPA